MTKRMITILIGTLFCSHAQAGAQEKGECPGFVEDRSLEAAIDEGKTPAKTTKSILQSDVVGYSFLRAAVKK